MSSPEVKNAYQKALEVRKHAYATYSRFLVGACFKLQGKDEYVTGCNVENASFGATVCAERVAIWNWVSQLKKTPSLEFVVIVTDTQDPVAGPCGMCLQVMSEFVKPDFPVYLANLSGIQKSLTMKDLMPVTFALEKKN